MNMVFLLRRPSMRRSRGVSLYVTEPLQSLKGRLARQRTDGADGKANTESMRKPWISIVAVCVGLAVPPSATAAGFFSATALVIAILADELFLGEAEGHSDGAGTLTIHSQTTPDLTCVGQFTSSAELGGEGQLRCSDGSSATFHFQRLSMRKGHGAGSFSRGAMSFSYGLAADEAAPYLKLPKGKKLSYNGKELALVELPD
jgi:hypothetical protein